MLSLNPHAALDETFRPHHKMLSVLSVLIPFALRSSINRTQQLSLQDIFPLLVLLARLVRLVVFPPHRLLALPTRDVAHDVSARRHVAFRGFALSDVDDGVEEEGFAVLAAEVLPGERVG